MAVRSALGACRARLISELLIENLLLLLAGGVSGVVLAYALLPLVRALLPADIARLETAAFNGRTLLVTFALCLLSGLVFGLLPALRFTAPKQNAPHSLRGLLVAGQFALAMMLLTGAGLLIRSFLLLDAVKPGFDTSRLLTMEIQLPESKYDKPERRVLFLDTALQKIDSLAGARAAVGEAVFDSLANHVPNQTLVIEGRLQSQDLERHSRNIVSDSYFGVLGIPLREGRLFAARDLPDGPPVAVVNQTMAQRYWSGRSPIGKRFKQVLPGMDGPWFSVIGVVADAVYNRDGRVIPIFYASYRQFPFLTGNSMVVKTQSDPLSLIPAIRQAVHAVEPDVPFFKVSSVAQRLGELDRPRRFETELLTAFAAFALILAAVGLHGLMSYSVEQRTREIGIRMALGATRRSVIQSVVGQILPWAVGGLGVGAAGSVIFARVLRSTLFGVSPNDPVTLVAVLALLAAGATLASAQPAARAAAIDANIALHHD